MTQISPTIRLMTPEETRTARQVNAGSVIEHNGISIPISAGRSDNVNVFKEGTILFVLSVNYRHDYIGLEIFDEKTGEEYNSIFIQYEWGLEEYLGKTVEGLSPVTITRRLIKTLIQD